MHRFCKCKNYSHFISKNISVYAIFNDQGLFVQNIFSLTNSLVVKMLTVLVSIISNSQVFLLKCKSYSHFFSKNISVYTIFNDQSFNDILTNDIVSFDQLGPDHPGPSCSKLTMSLVNDSLKFTSSDTQIC